MKNILTFIFLMTLSLSWSQKKELRTARKFVKDSLFVEAKDFLNKNKNLFENADNNVKSQFNLLSLKVYRSLGDFPNAFDKLMEVKSDPNVNKAYDVEANLLKAELVNNAIIDSEEKFFLESVKKLYLAYSIDPVVNIEYLYFAASNSVNGNDYKTSLEYYLVLKEKKYTGVITQYFITLVETQEEIQLSSDQELKLYAKDEKYNNPRSSLTESRYPEIVKNIALIYTKIGQSDKAIEAVKEARAENPNDLPLILTEANLYIELGDKEKFSSLITEAIAQDPNNANLYFNLGVVTAEMGDKVKAREHYEKAIEIGPSFESSYLNLVALILEGEKDIIEKMNSLGTSRTDNAKYDILKNERENLYMGCIPVLKGLLAQNKENKEAIKTLMNIYGTLGDNAGFKEMKALLD